MSNKMKKLTIKQASDIIGVGKTTILRHIQSGRLPAKLESLGSIKVYLIAEQDLDLIRNLKPGPKKTLSKNIDS